ncbi:hypothetical protein EUGRSUZ_J01064 [Eucalyptus grandis]|uniref:Uncharacterized protein n=2 Tax=Eucalyptus grandis TaxID=71139 RepID=A0ACC3J401_EUCGR|nr:hypothetical protein EUGRSUZ_J01064 [Eucalyptus grandis]
MGDHVKHLRFHLYRPMENKNPRSWMLFIKVKWSLRRKNRMDVAKICLLIHQPESSFIYRIRHGCILFPVKVGSIHD